MRRVLLAAAGVLALSAVPCQAITIAPGQYYTEAAGLTLGSQPPGYFRNDDAVFASIPLGFSFEFFGQTYTDFCIANNGNVQFSAGCSGEFTPTATLDTQTLNPMIAPYWADVDTRSDTISNVYLNTSVPNQVIITWDQVGYYEEHYDKRASFQLVIRGSGYAVPSDEGRIGFFFKNVDWETGDASDGENGFGGTEASVGFGDGLAASNPGEVSIPGSRQAGISSVVENNHYWFQLGAGGIPDTGSQIPEPGSMLLMLSGALLGLRMLKNR